MEYGRCPPVPTEGKRDREKEEDVMVISSDDEMPLPPPPKLKKESASSSSSSSFSSSLGSVRAKASVGTQPTRPGSSIRVSSVAQQNRERQKQRTQEGGSRASIPKPGGFDDFSHLLGEEEIQAVTTPSTPRLGSGSQEFEDTRMEDVLRRLTNKGTGRDDPALRSTEPISYKRLCELPRGTQTIFLPNSLRDEYGKFIQWVASRANAPERYQINRVGATLKHDPRREVMELAQEVFEDAKSIARGKDRNLIGEKEMVGTRFPTDHDKLLYVASEFTEPSRMDHRTTDLASVIRSANYVYFLLLKSEKHAEVLLRDYSEALESNDLPEWYPRNNNNVIQVVPPDEFEAFKRSFEAFFGHAIDPKPYDPSEDFRVEFTEAVPKFIVNYVNLHEFNPTSRSHSHSQLRKLEKLFSDDRKLTENEQASFDRKIRAAIQTVSDKLPETLVIDAASLVYSAQPVLWVELLFVFTRTGKIVGDDLKYRKDRPTGPRGVWSEECNRSFDRWIAFLTQGEPDLKEVGRLIESSSQNSDYKGMLRTLRKKERLLPVPVSHRTAAEVKFGDRKSVLTPNPYTGMTALTSKYQAQLQKAVDENDEAYYVDGACPEEMWETLLVYAIQLCVFPDPETEGWDEQLSYRLFSCLTIFGYAVETYFAYLGLKHWNPSHGENDRDESRRLLVGKLQARKEIQTTAELSRSFAVRPFDYSGIVRDLIDADASRDLVERLVKEEIVMNLVFGLYYDRERGAWEEIQAHESSKGPEEFGPGKEASLFRLGAKLWLPYNDPRLDMSNILREVMIAFQENNIPSIRRQALSRRRGDLRAAGHETASIFRPRSDDSKEAGKEKEKDGADARAQEARRLFSMSDTSVVAYEYARLDQDYEQWKKDGNETNLPSVFYEQHIADRRRGIFLSMLDRCLDSAVGRSDKTFDAHFNRELEASRVRYAPKPSTGAQEKRDLQISWVVNAAAKCLLEHAVFPVPVAVFEEMSKKSWILKHDSSPHRLYAREIEASLDAVETFVFPKQFFDELSHEVRNALGGGKDPLRSKNKTQKKAMIARFLDGLDQALCLVSSETCLEGGFLRPTDALYNAATRRLAVAKQLQNCYLQDSAVMSSLYGKFLQHSLDRASALNKDALEKVQDEVRFRAMTNRILNLLKHPEKMRKHYLEQAGQDADRVEVEASIREDTDLFWKLAKTAATSLKNTTRFTILPKYDVVMDDESKRTTEAIIEEKLRSKRGRITHREFSDLTGLVAQYLQDASFITHTRAIKGTGVRSAVGMSAWNGLPSGVESSVPNLWSIPNGRLPSMVAALNIAIHFLRKGDGNIPEPSILMKFGADVLHTAIALVHFTDYVRYLHNRTDEEGDEEEPVDILEEALKSHNDPTISSHFREERVFFSGVQENDEENEAGVQKGSDAFRSLYERLPWVRVVMALCSLRKGRFFHILSLTPMDVRALHCLIFNTDPWKVHLQVRITKSMEFRRSLGLLLRRTAYLLRRQEVDPESLWGEDPEKNLAESVQNEYLWVSEVLDPVLAGTDFFAYIVHKSVEFFDKAVTSDMILFGILGGLFSETVSITVSEEDEDKTHEIATDENRRRILMAKTFCPGISQALQAHFGFALGRVELFPEEEEDEEEDQEQDREREEEEEEEQKPKEKEREEQGDDQEVEDEMEEDRDVVTVFNDKDRDDEDGEDTEEEEEEEEAKTVTKKPDSAKSSSSSSSSSAVTAPKKRSKKGASGSASKDIKTMLKTVTIAPFQEELFNFERFDDEESSVHGLFMDLARTVEKRVAMDFASNSGKAYRQEDSDPYVALRKFLEHPYSEYDEYKGIVQYGVLNAQSSQKFVSGALRLAYGLDTKETADSWAKKCFKYHRGLLRVMKDLSSKKGPSQKVTLIELLEQDYQKVRDSNLDEQIKQFHSWCQLFSLCFNLRIFSIHLKNGNSSKDRTHSFFPARTFRANIVYKDTDPLQIIDGIRRYRLPSDTWVQTDAWNSGSGVDALEQVRHAFGYVVNSPLKYVEGETPLEIYRLQHRDDADAETAWKGLFVN